MALAVQLAVTNSGATMHPFFASVKDRRSCRPPLHASPTNTSGLATPKTDSHPTPLQPRKSLTRRKSRGRPLNEDGDSLHNGNDQKLEDGHGEAERTETSNLVSSYESSAQMAHADRNGKNGSVSENRRMSLESRPLMQNGDLELSENPRKRRRTESPLRQSSHVSGHIMNWEEQLVFAGFEQSSPEDNENRPQQSLSLEHQQLDLINLSNGIEEQRDPEHISSSTSTTPEKKSREVANTRTLSAEISPQKVMRLRNDGKLGSPKQKEGPDKSKRKLKPRDGGLNGTKKPVVIRYGADLHNRIQTGKKINSILSRTRRPDATTLSKLLPTQATKPAALAKKTHPFFSLSKVNKALEAKSRPSSRGRSKSRGPSRGGSVSPRKTSMNKSSLDSKARPNLGSAVNFSKMPKIPGTIAPLWPERNNMHVRGFPDVYPPDKAPFSFSSGRKLKSREIQLGEDRDVLESLRAKSRVESTSFGSFRKPGRRVMMGSELLNILQQRISSRLPVPTGLAPTPTRHSLSLSPGPRSHRTSAHSAVVKLFTALPNALSTFDRFDCEEQDWIHKYAPICTSEVLQPDGKLTVLRDWLVSLTISTVDNGKSVPKPSTKLKQRKKRRRSSELDDFIVRSDDESECVDDLTEPEDDPFAPAYLFGAQKSTVTSKHGPSLRKLSPEALKTTKAVVLSGPHGCGKTASVYAVAQELGFEVFEINAGSRRSGKDLADKVGDMTKNHLVHQLADSDGVPEGDQDLLSGAQEEVDSGRQSTMKSFFNTKPHSKPKTKAHAAKPTKKAAKKPLESPKKIRKQKQSLILLEEVDVLFEEDKQFWNTVISLLATSKRPIILTCTDETRLPQEDLIDCSILRLQAPSTTLAVDYLLLLTATEGHLLSRQALTTLYASKKGDLRSSIIQLNFWCQMAIGDNQGGLGWMLFAPDHMKLSNGITHRLRVISEDTVQEHDSVFSFSGTCEDNPSVPERQREAADLLCEAVENYSYDVEDWTDFMTNETDLVPESREMAYRRLKELEQGLDALSATDIFPGSGFLDSKYVSRRHAIKLYMYIVLTSLGAHKNRRSRNLG